MDEQMEIDQLTKQFRILDEEQSKLPAGPQKTALQQAAGKVKNQIVTLLNAKGVKPVQPQQQGPNTPDPSEYFGTKLPEGFEDNYFSGDYLTDEQRDYFTVKAPDNMPDERPSTETPKSYEMDADLRKRIFNAIGIPC
ncbi:hypothetical protein ACRB8Q_001332 [Escherichia coli]